MYTHRSWLKDTWIDYRKKQGWSQVEAAQRLGCGRHVIAGFERPNEFTYPLGIVMEKMFAMLLKEYGGRLVNHLPTMNADTLCPHCHELTPGPPAKRCCHCGKRISA